MAAPPTIHTADGIDALKFFATITEVTVHREGESPVFGESAVKVRIDDEGGGAFIVLEQMGSDAPGARRVMIDAEELDLIVKAAKKMLAQPGLGEQE